MPIRLDVTSGDEIYTLMRGQPQQVKPGDMIISDGKGIMSNIIYGPDQRTQIQPGTRNVLYTTYAPAGIARRQHHPPFAGYRGLCAHVLSTGQHGDAAGFRLRSRSCDKLCPIMESNGCTSIVVKLGTSTLTAGTSYLSPARMVELVRQLAQLHNQGCKVVLVSSGAMAAGRERLAFPQLPKAIPAKQMLSAVGQPRLMALYEQLFDIYKLTVAQVLLTRTDLADRSRYLNSRNTLSALLSQRVIPIINENDTVATEEIRLGDNDNLSALVANLIEADLLVMLTDQPGLFTADPRSDTAARTDSRYRYPIHPAIRLGCGRRHGHEIGNRWHAHQAPGSRPGQALRNHGRDCRR